MNQRRIRNGETVGGGDGDAARVFLGTSVFSARRMNGAIGLIGLDPSFWGGGFWREGEKKGWEEVEARQVRYDTRR